MFENIRNAWRLKGRLDDLEDTLLSVEKRLGRHVNATAEEVDLLRLEVQRLRGRIVGGNRVAPTDIEPEADWQAVDEAIRKGTFKE